MRQRVQPGGDYLPQLKEENATRFPAHSHKEWADIAWNPPSVHGHHALLSVPPREGAAAGFNTRSVTRTLGAWAILPRTRPPTPAQRGH